MWNEIGLSRIDEATVEKIKPNYIVCMDVINEHSLKAAKEFNVPIYLIHRKCYSELPYIYDNNLTQSESITISGRKR